jgi:phosphonopyruvate decarboxylase
MIHPFELVEYFKDNSIKFYSGVPDSLTYKLCSYIEEVSLCNNARIEFLPAAHEGIAVSYALGSYLANGNPGVVFMQNAGLGNILNPIVSIADAEVFDLPIVLLVGWRGKPGSKDEPQHLRQGSITRDLLFNMGFNVVEVDSEMNMAELADKISISADCWRNSKLSLLFEKDSIA